MRAWIFQDPKRLPVLGDKCPWSVGWYDADGKRKSKLIGSKSLAGRFQRKTEGELAAGLCTVGRKRTTWADFRKQYLGDVASTKAANTRAQYVRAFDHFEAIAKPGYVDAITTATVDKFIAKRSAGTIDPDTKECVRPEPATVNKELRHLRAALRKAAKWGMVPQSPDFAMMREEERDPYFVDDATFAALYGACGDMTRPEGRRYPSADWWKALLAFAYLTGWRIGEILDLRRDDVDLETGIATVDAASTKGRREARIELHPVVINHLRAIVEFQPMVFDWPHHERTLWADFAALKTAAGVEFPGAFHRLRFGFANANVDALPADLLQKLMRHRDAKTTRQYINAAERMKRAGTADKLHVPAVLKVKSVG
jgi:integrase